MTLIIDHGLSRSRSRPSSLWLRRQVTRLTAWFRKRQLEHNIRRTARQLDYLPFDVRKDIGWPSSDMKRVEKR